MKNGIEDNEKERLYLMKSNKLINAISKEVKEELSALKNVFSRADNLGSGAYLKNYLAIVINKNQKIAHAKYSNYKEIFLNGIIDSEDKKKEIISKIESLKDPWIEHFKIKVGDDATLRNHPKDLLINEFKRGIDEIIQRIKSDIEIEYLENRIAFKSNLFDQKNQYEYDFALSFAGENRDYVKKVAEKLYKAGISIFYDDYNEVDSWGKDLIEYFDDIYRNKSKYCIMFLSKYYKDKIWTRLERRSALTKALKENREYILPVRFDDTDISGLLPSIGCFYANEKTPEQIADLALRKLNKKHEKENLSDIENKLILDVPKILLFKIEPSHIKKGEIAKLIWKVKDISNPLVIENEHAKGGKGEYNFGLNEEGFFPVNPIENVTYKLIAQNSFGKVEETVKLSVVF